MISVKVEQSDINKLSNLFQATEKESDKAVRLSLKETTNWARSQAIKNLSALTKLTQKVLRQKTRVYYQSNGFLSKINFYVNPMNLIRFGARQNKYGVTSKIMSVKSAFITTGYGKFGSYRAVYQRTGEFRTMIKGRYRGKRREAISPVKVELRPQTEQVIKQIEPQIMNMFFVKLKQKLSWITGKK